MDKNEIILYETSDRSVKLNVNTDGETVWLNRAQLSELFERDVSVIGRHVNAVEDQSNCSDGCFCCQQFCEQLTHTGFQPCAHIEADYRDTACRHTYHN